MLKVELKKIRRMSRFVFFLSLMAFAALMPETCWSHGVAGNIVRAAGYLIVAAYDDGEPMNYAAVKITSPDAEFAYQTGRTDRNGHFMFSPDHAGQWQVEVQDGLGHRLALDLEVAGDKAEPEDKGPQIPRGSMGMSRTAEVIIGLSIIFGIFGFLYGWKARHAVQCRPREGCDQVRK